MCRRCCARGSATSAGASDGGGALRKGTVKKGVKLLIAAVCLLIAASFYHDELAGILFLSPSDVQQLVYFSFFWGGILGGAGIMVVVTGLLRSAGREDALTRLAPTLWLLVVAVIIFFILLYRSFGTPQEPPQL